jgi:monoamine oxidase
MGTPRKAAPITRRTALKGIAAGTAVTGVAASGVEIVTAEENRTVDVIVVGAGAAGTMAATHFVKAGKTVALLEANNRIGGRLKRGKIAGQDIDLGGQWVGPTQDRLIEVANDLGLNTYRTYMEGDMLVDIAGSIYKGLALPPDVIGDYLKTVARINELANEIDPAQPWNAPNVEEWDSISMKSWAMQTAETDHVRDLLRVVVEVVLCVPPEQVSLLQFLWYIKSGQGYQKVTDAAGGAQQDLYEECLVSVPERLAQALGDRVILDAPVQAITQDDSQVTAITAKGSWTAKRLVMAAPPATAARIDYSPVLPYKRRGLMDRSPMGAVIKCFIAYEKPFWREAGLNGQSISSRSKFASTFDITAPGNEHGILCGFFDGGPAMEWADKSPAEREAKAIADIAHVLGEQANSPIEYVEQNWPRERWSIGGYACVPGPGVTSVFGDAIRQPCGRIHWAGTETADVWAGYVDGALRSGDRVANEVLAVL